MKRLANSIWNGIATCFECLWAFLLCLCSPPEPEYEWDQPLSSVDDSKKEVQVDAVPLAPIAPAHLPARQRNSPFNRLFDMPVYFSTGVYALSAELYPTREMAQQVFHKHMEREISLQEIREDRVRFGFTSASGHKAWVLGINGKGSKPVWVCEG